MRKPLTSLHEIRGSQYEMQRAIHSQGESTAHQETLCRSDSLGNTAWKETDWSVRSAPDTLVLATGRLRRAAISSRRRAARSSSCASSAWRSRISLWQSAMVVGKWVGLRLMVLAPATRTLQLSIVRVGSTLSTQESTGWFEKRSLSGWQISVAIT